MFHNDVEKAYDLAYESTGLLQKTLETSYLEGYLENVENILEDFQVRVMDGVPDEVTVRKIENIYKEMQGLSLEEEELRKVTQFVLLKVTMKDQLQPNHQLTPDSIGFLFVYMLENLVPKKNIRLLDPAVGMGNLLFTLLKNLKLADYFIESFGVDIDETLLEVAAADSRLLKEQVTLYHQDAMQPLFVDPVDVAVSDLPVGYYPIDEVAQEFQVASPTGHTYAHHLLIEKSMAHVKPAGYGLFLVPSNLLESQQTPLFTAWLKENAYLQSFIHLPTSLFRSKESRKSILLLQKQGEDARQAKEVLLGELSSLKDIASVQKFFREFNQWKIENIKK